MIDKKTTEAISKLMFSQPSFPTTESILKSIEESSALIQPMPLVDRSKAVLHSLSSALLTENESEDKELLYLQSIIPMVHTLILEGRHEELYKILKQNFSEYYN